MVLKTKTLITRNTGAPSVPFRVAKLVSLNPLILCVIPEAKVGEWGAFASFQKMLPEHSGKGAGTL